MLLNPPNYALALALSATGWSNAETARRLNEHCALRGHRGIAIDAARVGRWIRDGERPRSPVPDLLAELLSAQLKEWHTAQSLCLARPRIVRAVLDEEEYAALLKRATAAKLPLATYVLVVIRAAIADTGCPDPVE